VEYENSGTHKQTQKEHPTISAKENVETTFRIGSVSHTLYVTPSLTSHALQMGKCGVPIENSQNAIIKPCDVILFSLF